MSATSWKRKGAVRPYALRNWPIPHIAALPSEFGDPPVRVHLAMHIGAVRQKQQGVTLAAPLRAGLDSSLLPGEVAVLGNAAGADPEFGGVDSEKGAAEGDRNADS